MTDMLEHELRATLAEHAERLPRADGDAWVSEFNDRSRHLRRSERLRVLTRTGATAVLAGCAAAIVLLTIGGSTRLRSPQVTRPAIPAAFVGWTAVPTQATAAQTATAAKRCEWAASHKAHLRQPLITDARGPYIAVLFVDQHDNYERFCMYGPNLGLGTAGQIRSPDQLNPAPGPDGIQHSHAGGTCDPETGRAVGAMFGRSGTDVTGAILRFSNGASVHATVKNGFYVVWWPWALWPERISVMTKSGTTTEINMATGPAHSC